MHGQCSRKKAKGPVNLGNITWNMEYAKHPKSVFSIPIRSSNNYSVKKIISCWRANLLLSCVFSLYCNKSMTYIENPMSGSHLPGLMFK